MPYSFHSPFIPERISNLYPVNPADAAGALQVITITDLDESFQFPMKRPGASIAATASAVADCDASGVAASDISGAADSEAAGGIVGAASSPLSAGREMTITARSAIPIIAAISTRGEVPCLGAALGFAGAGLTGAGVVVTFTRDALFAPPSGTGGITILLAEVAFLAADFFFAGAFLATFLATAFFLATFLATAFFFAGAFLVAFFVTFLAAAFFFTGAFLATFLVTFLAAAFFLTGAFFFTATVKLLCGLSDLVWAKFSLES